MIFSWRRNERYSWKQWRDADDIMMIWGRLKLQIPIEASPIFTNNDIDFVRSALDGCSASQKNIKIF